MKARQTRTVLLTGFDPFGGDTVNPSWEAVSRLHGKSIAGRQIVAEELPTTFDGAPKALRAALRRHAPELVLCIGQAGGRASMSLERVAINVNDARIPDNAGAQPIDTPVVRRGPAAYFTTLPIKAMHADLRAAGIPAEISQTAGTFVCNQVFYVLMHALAGTRIRGGFVHIPFLPQQVEAMPGTPSLDLDTIVAGLQVCIETALRTRRDLRIGAGATH
ncbi:MAG: pyroglutamyl-peptidase I [Lysobacter sp.]|nr:pyroglutamyl-peptidase I [Lysobacter sp.]